MREAGRTTRPETEGLAWDCRAASPGNARPLLVRFGPLGDLVVLTAAIRALSAAYQSSCDLVTSFSRAEDLLRGLDEVGFVHVTQGRRTPYLLSGAQQRLVAWLRTRPAGPVYVVEERRPEKVLWLLRRGGVADELLVGPWRCARGDLEHTISYLRRLIRQPLGVLAPCSQPDDAATPLLVVTEQERGEAKRWIDSRGWTDEPLVLFQPLSRRANRGRWPGERWAQVARSLLERLPRARVVVIGAAGEARKVDELVGRLSHPRVAAAAADLPLRRLLALLTLAHSCISLDTGPSHAAAALGCPLVVLAGRADPRRNAPWAPADRLEVLTGWPPEHWPSSRREWEETHRVDLITVGAVVAAWERVTDLGGPEERGSAPRPESF